MFVTNGLWLLCPQIYDLSGKPGHRQPVKTVGEKRAGGISPCGFWGVGGMPWGGGRRLPGKAGLFSGARKALRQEAESLPPGSGKQKESVSWLSVLKSKLFFTFLLTSAFSNPSVWDGFSIHLFTFVCGFWRPFLQKRRMFSARARAADRKKHFFSPHRVARLSALRRILLRIPGNFLPEGGVLACSFPVVFLFGAGKALPAEKQKERRKG